MGVRRGAAPGGPSPARGRTQAAPGFIDDGVPGDSPERALSITALNTAIQDAVQGMLPSIWISGEISSFKTHQNGHWYLTLKDEAGSSIDCVIWNGERSGFPMQPEVGMRVFAFGELSVWAKVNRIQFKVRKLEDQGEGIWRKAFEKTKAKLEAEGLLDSSRKRPLPRFPRVVGVVTSPSGAALHDIVSIIARRNPTIDIVVIPTLVQGDSAPESLVDALERAARWGGADVLIVGRGGGSREDLWSFNDERVARAIAASPVPTVSAVGHEADVSIADFVADVRAATPSAAAELVAPVLEDLRADLRNFGEAMRDRLVQMTRESRRELSLVRAAVRSGAARRMHDAGRDLSSIRQSIRAAAGQRVSDAQHTLALRRERLKRGTLRNVERSTERVSAIAGRLNALSPLNILSRGYAVPRTRQLASLPKAAQFKPGTKFNLKLQDGEVDATTDAVRLEDGP